ncbi:hypothetical protein XELAEV_18033502mg [Xenopus laevis]|uniref:Uncharacterized protein n=1 Tax=Xenopus laevis TaxID=8355 RepID=A0A974HEH1_XENLA|nr:hypothetical protein XELAEV_18033502mg [Xenopus laevis]
MMCIIGRSSIRRCHCKQSSLVLIFPLFCCISNCYFSRLLVFVLEEGKSSHEVACAVLVPTAAERTLGGSGEPLPIGNESHVQTGKLEECRQV